MQTSSRLLATIAALLAAAPAWSIVSLPPVFSDHMVLQRELPVHLWGKADPGETITVEFAGQRASATTDSSGNWKAQLPPLAASAEGRTLTVQGSTTVTFSDVLVGEVWFASGQSNMEKQIGPRQGQLPCDNHEQELAAANHPHLRIFQGPRNGRSTPGDLTHRWLICTPENMEKSRFSAAGYYFGRKLHRELGVPVGILHSSFGGTRVEAWTPASAYDDSEPFAEVARAVRLGGRYQRIRVGGLYDTMVRPYAPFTLRGFLWYQGESNLLNNDIAYYPEKLRLLVDSWRKDWARADAPFYFVRLAPHLYSPRKQMPALSAEALPLFWEAQSKALEAISHSGAISITDAVSDVRDIHPTNKRDVGERLAALALARTYGQLNHATDHPTLTGSARQGSTLMLSFAHAEGLRTRDGGPPVGVTVAGEDGVFYPALALIEKRTLAVSAPEVPAPVHARIAFHEAANPNLENGDGLPVLPGRTDTLPVSSLRDSTPDDIQRPRLATVEQPRIPEQTVRITDLGAVPNDGLPDTSSIAAAIEALAASGGGRVVLPEGTWNSGPLTLRSGINLHLEKGALLQFSENREDYPLVTTVYEGKSDIRCQSPLSGSGLDDIAITGEGTIDGAGQVWRPVKKMKRTEAEWAALLASGGVVNAKGDIWYPSEGALIGNEDPSTRNTDDPEKLLRVKDALRPVLLSLVECKRVLLEGVTFRNSPAWNVHPLLCEHLTVRKVTIQNPWWAQNGDGIDLESCRNVLVEDSTFNVGDDAICLKSGRDAEGRKRARPTENVLIRRCKVIRGHGGFVIGSEMSGGVRNIHVVDCEFDGTDVGLRFKSTRGRGGVVENIVVEGVRMKNIRREGIFFNLFYGGGDREAERPADETTPVFRSIHISGIDCESADRAIRIEGLPELPTESIRITDSTFNARTGLQATNVDGLWMDRVELRAAEGVAIDLTGVRDMRWKSGSASSPQAPLATLRDCKRIELPDTVGAEAIRTTKTVASTAP